MNDPAPDRMAVCGSLPEGVRAPSDLPRLMARIAATGTRDRVSFGEIVDALGPSQRSLLLLLPALLAFSPATIVFGVATMCGLIIALVSLQLLLRRDGLWLPRFIRDASLKRSVLQRAVTWLDRPLGWLQTRARPRLLALVTGPLGSLPMFMTALLGLALPFLEMVPLSATTGGFAITLMVLGILLRDGLLALAGMIVWAFVVTFASKFAVGSFSLLASVWTLPFVG